MISFLDVVTLSVHIYLSNHSHYVCVILTEQDEHQVRQDRGPHEHAALQLALSARELSDEVRTSHRFEHQQLGLL